MPTGQAGAIRPGGRKTDDSNTQQRQHKVDIPLIVEMRMGWRQNMTIFTGSAFKELRQSARRPNTVTVLGVPHVSCFVLWQHRAKGTLRRAECKSPTFPSLHYRGSVRV